MTDKSAPRTGGDDGSAGTPTERLLREAMNARTSLITAHDLRPAAPPRSRIRRLRPVYAVTVPLLGLAAAAAIGVVTLHGSPVADRETPPPPAATLTASPSPTATPTATPTPTATGTPTATETPAGEPETDTPSADVTPTSPAKSYTFRGVKLRIPAGWRVDAANPASDHLCILSPGAPQGATADDCQPYGVDLAVFDMESQIWPTLGDLDDKGGWGHQPYCPIWGNPHQAGGEQITYSAPVKTTPTVSGRPARKSTWQSACGKSPFKAQIWALPEDQVFVSAIGLKADYQDDLQSIVDSLDVSGHPAPTIVNATVSVSGIKSGQQLLNDGSSTAEFSVTFKNNGSKKLTGSKAVVYGTNYPGAPAGKPVAGMLAYHLPDNFLWRPLDPNRIDTLSDPATGVPVDLDPGQSVTVSYQLRLTPQDGPGFMPLTVGLSVPGNLPGPDLTVVNLSVVSK
ncbi:hypothetical protein [Streptomyces rubellomurinus]|uniref:hypothetical protein n=1 Tax=Streptomyces rubellomurinus (strain ATCC 31215) TaxID=359131 RepID=UPI00069727F2|nr:hypothetical protein [Streptomyces rubellomurinus]